MRSDNQAGFSLLEVMVAVAILAFIGTVALERTIEAGQAVSRARAAESAFEEANAFFTAASLWPRADLDRHLGTRAQGSWLMAVTRRSPTLYELRLLDPESEAVILHTSVFRPSNELTGD